MRTDGFITQADKFNECLMNFVKFLAVVKRRKKVLLSTGNLLFQ